MPPQLTSITDFATAPARVATPSPMASLHKQDAMQCLHSDDSAILWMNSACWHALFASQLMVHRKPSGQCMRCNSQMLLLLHVMEQSCGHGRRNGHTHTQRCNTTSATRHRNRSTAARRSYRALGTHDVSGALVVLIAHDVVGGACGEGGKIPCNNLASKT